jgi:cytochrome c oxidase subunit 2
MRHYGPFALALVALALAGSLAFGQGQPARVEQGGKWFMDNGCYGCHTVGKLGTPIGPDLSHIGTKFSLDYLERWLRDPVYQRPSAHMPRLELSEEQVRAVAAYLSSLR